MRTGSRIGRRFWRAGVPAELRADAVVVLSGADGARLAVVVEVQLRRACASTRNWSCSRC
jgi:hypothetical protein